jgi:hypothetical protein
MMKMKKSRKEKKKNFRNRFDRGQFSCYLSNGAETFGRHVHMIAGRKSMKPPLSDSQLAFYGRAYAPPGLGAI